MNHTLQARIYRQLDKQPEKRSLTFINKRGEFSWRTLEEVYTEASGYASKLLELGVTKGDVCILVLPSNEFAAMALLGTLLVNALPLLVAPPTLQGFNPYLLQVLRRLIRKTGAKIVIAPESMKEMQADLEGISKKAQFIFGQKEFNPSGLLSSHLPLPSEDDLAALQLTSGTTGFPRVCVWQQKNVMAALDGMGQAMRVNGDDIYLNWTPLYHDMGLVNNFFLCLTKGIPLALLSPIDFVKKPALWLQSLSRTGSTTTWSPNFGFAITTKWARESELTDVRLEGVKGFWNAAERIHPDTMQAFYERFALYGLRPEAMKTNFGCAENIGGATFSDPDGKFVTEWVDAKSFQEKRIAKTVAGPSKNGEAMSVVGVGRPHPGIRIKILSRKGKELPDGHIGEVALDTPSRMTGYLKQADETKKAIRGNLVRTGDLGYLRGNELFWVGRVKERIAIRGKKLDPSDFEGILLDIPDLRAGCFVAFGIDNNKAGTQEIVIVSEVRNSDLSRPYTEISEDIRAQVNLKLGVPVNDVVFVQKGTLTKTSSGKRRHRYFRQLYLKGGLECLSKSGNKNNDFVYAK